MANTKITNHIVDKTFITGQTAVTAADGDYLLVSDASDSGALKKVLASDLIQTSEEVQDLIGAMFSSNTETGITATYQDGDGTIDLVIGDDTIVSSMLDTNIAIAGTLGVTGNITGTLATAAQTNITSLGTLTALTGGTGDLIWDTNTLFVDSSANKIYIGDTASHTDDFLQIESPASGGGHGIQIRRNDSNTDQGIGRILFGNNTDTDLVQIHAKTDGATDNGALIFSTQPDSGSLTERMRIDHDGKVGIGTASPSKLVHIRGAGDGAHLRIARNGVSEWDFSIGGTSTLSGVGAGALELLPQNANTANEFAIGTAGSTAALFHLTNAQNYFRNKVGIGGASPIRKLDIIGASGTDSTLLLHMDADTAGGETRLEFKADSTNDDRRIKAAILFRRDDPGTRGTGALHICVNGVNSDTNVGLSDSKIKFDAGGEISITKGRTNFSAEEESFSPGSHNGYMVDINGQTASSRAATNTQTHRSFLNPNGTVGSITTSGTGTTYGGTSDYRLKENVVTDWDGTTLLKQLKPSKFNFKADADTIIQGFLAHEVSSIVPEAVVGEKDAVYTAEEAIKGLAVEGQPKYQQIDQAKLVPLLVKTIQELEARIATLEG